MRRFLPRYRELYALCLERKAQSEASQRSAHQRACTLATVAGIPCPPPGDQDEYTLRLSKSESDGLYGDVRVGSTYVYVELRGLPMDKALRILQVLYQPDLTDDAIAGVR